MLLPYGINNDKRNGRMIISKGEKILQSRRRKKNCPAKMSKDRQRNWYDYVQISGRRFIVSFSFIFYQAYSALCWCAYVVLVCEYV